jgi:hypothetical protein
MPSLRPSKARQKMLTDDFKDLLRPLNANVVKYLIIGGHAFGVHAEPRRTSTTPSAPTKRMPTRFFVQQPSLAPGSPAEVRQTSPTEPLFKLVFPPDRIDILQRIDGVEFDEAYLNRVQGNIDGEVQAAVISREDLIRNKLASGREQDLLDVKALRAAEKAAKNRP